jgi:hypothetical protein
MRPGCCHGHESYLFPEGEYFAEGTFFKIDPDNTPEDSNYLAVTPVTDPTDKPVGMVECGGLDTTEWGESCPAPICTGGRVYSSEIPYPEDWTNLQILQFEEACRCCGWKFMREDCC